uniref:Transmembrane epididymal protein 1 n=1 Tax=Castor canadensis TaxID=51338 RepID=A0A8C0WAE8_CASCN
MGNFNGHFYPGLYIFSYGLYQAIVVSKAMVFNDSLQYFSCLPKNKGRWAKLWKISYGSLLKIATGSMLAVYVVFCLDDGMVLMSTQVPPRFVYPKEWQHITMFNLFNLSGCVDVMSRNVLPQRCVVLEKAAMVLSFYELLLLLVSHAKDTSGVELHVHSLLILVVSLLTLVLTAQLWASRMFHLQLMEAFLFLMMVSGYPWEDDDIGDLKFVTTFFCWHLIINALCLMGIYGFSSFWHRCYRPTLKPMGSKEASYHKSTPGPLYRLLQEGEQLKKDDQALLLPKSSPCDRA